MRWVMVGVAVLTLAGTIRAQDVKPDELKNMRAELKAGRTARRSSSARVAELEKQNQAQAAQLEDLKRQAADFADRTLFLSPATRLGRSSSRPTRRSKCSGNYSSRRWRRAKCSNRRYSWIRIGRCRRSSDNSRLQVQVVSFCLQLATCHLLLLSIHCPTSMRTYFSMASRPWP